jgi:ribonuclease-3
MNFFLRWFPSINKQEGHFFTSIRNIIGYKPKDPLLYQLAFRHSSASKKESRIPRNNQRLEFLGDAILSAVIADYLYNRYPDQDEGYLTSMRSKIVSRNNLNHIAEKIGLHRLIVSKLDKRKPAKSLGGDTLEALIGAIYLDKGMTEARSFIVRTILEGSMPVGQLEAHVISYKGRLIEWAQKERKRFEYKLLEERGKQHNMIFVMGLYIDDELVEKGEGASKKIAEEQASKEAFLKLVRTTL